MLIVDALSPYSAVMHGIELGAVDVLEKPLSSLKLRNIWQHVVRKARPCRGTFSAWRPRISRSRPGYSLLFNPSALPAWCSGAFALHWIPSSRIWGMLTGRVLGHAQRMSSADLSAGLAVKPEVKTIEVLKVRCAFCHSLLGCAAGADVCSCSCLTGRVTDAVRRSAGQGRLGAHQPAHAIAGGLAAHARQRHDGPARCQGR